VAGAPAPEAQVLVVGVPGLRWDQVSRATTPVLYRFAAEAARGALSVRSATERTCADAGWLTMGAGNRAASVATCGERTGIDAWPDLQRRNADVLDGREIGALGAALQRAGTCAESDPHSALAVGPSPSLIGVCHVVLRELIAADGDGLATADAELGALLRGYPAAETVIVAGISELPGQRPHLHVLAIRGQAFTAGRELRSPSTSRAPYAQLIDVAPTVLELLGVTAPESMSGRPAVAVGPARDLDSDHDRLADLDRRATGQRSAVVPFVVLLVAALLVLVGLALRVPTARRAVGVAGVVVMAMPAASFVAMLVPWWRGGAPVLALIAISLLVSATLAGVALRGPWRHRPLGPVAFIAAATAGVVAVDLLTGARLQMDSVLGYSPYVAGRFVGLGNPGFAVFGTAAVLAAALWVRPGPRAWMPVAAVAVAAVALDGAPRWGDDFGGVLALVPAFVVVGSLLATGVVRWSRLLLAGVGAVVVVTAFALLDYGRGVEHRTHLGRFVAQVRDGTAGQVIHRKAQANLDLLTHSPFTLLVPVLLLGAVWLLLRPPEGLAARLRSHPQARAALLGVLALTIVGGLVNDSGTAIPAVALLLAVPVGLALGVSAETDEAPA
jgi:hypothetical protein